MTRRDGGDMKLFFESIAYKRILTVKTKIKYKWSRQNPKLHYVSHDVLID